MVHPGSEFPIKQCHDRAGIELAIAGCFHHFHFVDDSGFVVNDEPIDSLALKTEMLRFYRILGIGSSKRILFVLRRDPNYVGGKARR